MYVQLASTLTIPQASPNAPAVLNPDNLAQVEAGESPIGTNSAQVLGIVNTGFGAYMRTGMGCAGGKCNCGGKCGMGIFDSGLDVTGWGWQEWLSVLGLAYVVGSVVSTTGRGVRSVRKTVRARQSRARRRAQLKRQLGSL